MGFISEYENSRTIDYERNIVLTLGKIGGRPPTSDLGRYEEFILDWNGIKIPFIGYYKAVKNSDSTWDVCWTINLLIIPDSAAAKGHEIKQILTEAMEAYGVKFGKVENQISSFEVKFTPQAQKKLTASDQNPELDV